MGAENDLSIRNRIQALLDRDDAHLWLFAAGTLFLTVLPLALNTFWTRIALGVLLWVGLAQSWNMIGGYAGYLDFGHGAYFGAGAFVTGIVMTELELPFVAGLLIAGVFCAVLAYAVGVPTLRLSGAYFAIATWAFAEAIKELALIIEITGGTYGMTIPTGPGTAGIPLVGWPDEMFFYYLMLVLTLGTIALAYWLFEHSEFGFRVKAIRDHEDAAQSLGIDATKIKRRVYVLSCAIAALFGSANAYYITFVHPNDVLAPIITDQMIIMALLGGLGTIGGPIIGGVLIFLLNRMTSLFLGQTTLYLPLIGVLIMGIVLFAPSGVVGILRGEVGREDVKRNLRELAEKFNIL
ncbi:branched-chain amino acid ABC transporter permease [Halorientalis pallida]|uniref:Branched-chain amino acid ABC transporter permease n=1 Tax=Halorientalis pallida TaxID=2479928 RepID=A0A498KVE3_9EURY|nr:branched-chain amino acid ABC transporter permease [Halorientalis pallida]RXK47489.1 branched-chain amino acid ABC transporter permease [Halorientalis pallida]